ncbi:hypothetical protein LSH36_1348g00020, partial [Paralvinella palmiformis]
MNMDNDKKPLSEVNNVSRVLSSRIPVSANKLPVPSNRFSRPLSGKRKAELEPEV